MNKISVSRLEIVRRNPTAFLKTLGDAATPGFGYPKSMRWLNAVNAFHSKNDIREGVDNLEEALGKRKDTRKNRQELETLILALHNFETSCNDRKLSFVNSRESISLELSANFKLSGQIPLIYMSSIRGYAGYFISDKVSGWQEELKYPIVQNYIAENIFGCATNEVEVGVVNFFTGEISAAYFNRRQIQDANAEMEKLTNQLEKGLKDMNKS